MCNCCWMASSCPYACRRPFAWPPQNAAACRPPSMSTQATHPPSGYTRGWTTHSDSTDTLKHAVWASVSCVYATPQQPAPSLKSG